MDVFEKEDHYGVRADLPGIPKENIKINLEGDLLTLSAERSESRAEENENYHLKERRYGKMSRTIRLPQDAIPEKAQAKFENGELQLLIPREGKKPEQVRSIEIQ